MCIRDSLHRMGHDVVCLVGNTTINPNFPLPDIRFDESQDGMLNEAIQLARSEEEPEFWIHSAAVLDYQPECKSGKIKVLSHSSEDIPSSSAHLTFDKKFTYAYGDSWIIE